MAGTWTPSWQANQAYSLVAVVKPTATVFAGYTWRCTTAGTSGATEPTWPDPGISPTIVDGTVTWSVGTGFRQAIQYGIQTVVATFATANPTIVRGNFTVRPRSLTTAEQPCFFIGDLTETVEISQGTRTRTFAGFSAFLTDTMGEQIESNDRMNFAADVLVDYFTDAFHAAGGRSLITLTGCQDTEIEDAGTRFPALEFLFAETKIQEGRA